MAQPSDTVDINIAQMRAGVDRLPVVASSVAGVRALAVPRAGSSATTPVASAACVQFGESLAAAIEALSTGIEQDHRVTVAVLNRYVTTDRDTGRNGYELLGRIQHAETVGVWLDTAGDAARRLLGGEGGGR